MTDHGEPIMTMPNNLLPGWIDNDGVLYALDSTTWNAAREGRTINLTAQQRAYAKDAWQSLASDPKEVSVMYAVTGSSSASSA